ncbi:family 43 glycosylhydrolase, partial [Dietzia natronolimnaea]
MKTSRGARALGAAALAVVVPLVSATAAVPAAANPVISSIAPDPSVQRGADGAFHVYASSDDWSDGAGYRLVPHFRSFDLVEWEYVGDAFGSRPSWAPSGSYLWAPDVHVTDAGAVMYYTTGGPAPCIGMATAPGIEGPWTHGGAPIVCYGADAPYRDLDPMDPEVVFTADGPVMFMGNFEGIHAVRMNPAGTALIGDPVLVAGTGVEAPAVVSREGRTHLFTSAGLCCNGEQSQYRVLGGRADDVMGPYSDRQQRPLVQGPGSPLPGDVILKGDADWVGPGHVDVTTDDAGQDWMLYHAAPRGSAVLPNGVQRRYMMLDRLDWVGGWPVVGDGTPSSTRSADPV